MFRVFTWPKSKPANAKRLSGLHFNSQDCLHVPAFEIGAPRCKRLSRRPRGGSKELCRLLLRPSTLLLICAGPLLPLLLPCRDIIQYYCFVIAGTFQGKTFRNHERRSPTSGSRWYHNGIALSCRTDRCVNVHCRNTFGVNDGCFRRRKNNQESRGNEISSPTANYPTKDRLVRVIKRRRTVLSLLQVRCSQ